MIVRQKSEEEFSQVLRTIITNSGKRDINFYELMFLLRENNIKFFSKD